MLKTIILVIVLLLWRLTNPIIYWGRTSPPVLQNYGVSQKNCQLTKFTPQRRIASKNTHKNHRTLFRTEVESFVYQDARYNMK